MQVEACMIDLDGTLVDTMGDFEAVVNLMLQDLGLSALPRTHLEGMVGKGSEHLIQAVLIRQMPLQQVEILSTLLLPSRQASWMRWIAINYKV